MEPFDGKLTSKRISLFAILIVLIGLFALRFSWLPQIDTRDYLHDGVLDLSSWDHRGGFTLSGDWEFYWQEFLTEKDFAADPKPDLYAYVPEIWNRYVIDGKQLTGDGYATYRLHVTGARPGFSYAIRIAPPATSYKVIIDGKEVTEVGTVGKTAKTSAPKYRVSAITFTPNSDSFNIILYVSNYVYARGGAWDTIAFGTADTIQTASNLVVARDFFLIGIFFVMSLVAGCLFILRRDKSMLMFLLMFPALLYRTLAYGSFSLGVIAPSLPFSIMIKCAYLTLAYIAWVAFLLLADLFPKDLAKKSVVHSITIYSIGAMGFILFAPLRLVTQGAYFFEAMTMLIFVVGIILLLQAVHHKRHLAIPFTCGVLAMAICAVRDTMFQNGVLKSGFVEYLPFGFFLMTLVWGATLAVNYDEALRRQEAALIAKNIADYRERQMELRYLRSQIRPHFIHNALNTIISLSRTDFESARTLLVEFSKYLRNCYDNNLADMIPLENELSFVHSYMAIEQARFGERLQVDYQIDNVSLNVPALILQPLVENAVLHGVRSKPDGGRIIVYVRKEGEMIRLGVSDNGVGISPEKIALLLDTERETAGVGVSNINRRLQKIYGTSLHIENSMEGGVDIYMLIPKQ